MTLKSKEKLFTLQIKFRSKKAKIIFESQDDKWNDISMVRYISSIKASLNNLFLYTAHF
jgi:hypothetical protein